MIKHRAPYTIVSQGNFQKIRRMNESRRNLEFPSRFRVRVKKNSRAARKVGYREDRKERILCESHVCDKILSDVRNNFQKIRRMNETRGTSWVRAKKSGKIRDDSRVEGDTRASSPRREDFVSVWSSRHSFGYPWLAGYRYHAASLLVPALRREQQRAFCSLLLGLDCSTQGCNRLRPCGVVAGAAVYSWKWSRYETKREGIALLAGERRGF